MFLGKKNLILISTAILLAFGLAWGEESVYMGDLGVIVITPTRGPRMVKDLPTNVSVITREEIAESGAQNVGEVLKNSLGVKIRRYGTLGASSEIALRGCSAYQTLVMVDGRSVNSISDGIANLSQFPIDNIERIEIVRGPASALYGANALGGVVNIITREAKEEKVIADVNFGMGSFGTQISRLNFATRDANIKAYFTISNNTSNGWRENSTYDNHNFTGRLAYDAGKIGNFELRGGYHRGELGLPGTNYKLVNWERIFLEEKFASDPNHNQEDEKEYVILEYSNGGENSKLLLKAYGSNDQRRDRNPDKPRDDLHENVTQGVEAQLDTLYGITLGMDIHQDKYRQRDEIDSETKISEKTLNESIFLQEILSLKPLTTTMGLRFDHHSAYGSQINPSFSLVYQPRESLKFSLNLGRGFRAPTFCDLYQPYTDYVIYQAQGNLDLKPEKAWAYDLGFEHQLGNLLLSRITLFRTNIEDLIEWAAVDPAKPWGLWIPSNVAEAYTQGVEIEFIHQIMSGLSHSINYMYLHSAGKSEDEDKYQIAPYRPHNRANYRINYTNNFGLKISLGTEYVSEQWSARGKTGDKLPDCFLLNARIAQRIRNLEAYISLDNLFNKKYQTVFGYPMPGRTIMAGISWKFGS